MNTEDSGSAAGREAAPEGKDPNGPGPDGAAAEGKDGWEGGEGDKGGWTATEARYDEMEGMMQEDAFDINTTECGPNGWPALAFALGVENEPHDEKAVKLVLSAPGVDVNAPNHWGRTMLVLQCSWGRRRNVELLLADPRVDVNHVDVKGEPPLHIAANLGRDRCVELLLADPRVDVNQVNPITGSSPLYTAANRGMDRSMSLHYLRLLKLL
jgi:ankyrin repeat protein